jgi:hypothetical protein
MKIFNLQNIIDELLLIYKFNYSHTLNSYSHYYFNNDICIIFDPDECYFIIKSNNSECIIPYLGDDKIFINKIENNLKNMFNS